MVDCFDRIHLKLNEVVLRPLKELAEHSDLTSVTIRPPGRGPRINVTIDKLRSSEPERPPQYRWAAHDASIDANSHSRGQIWASDSSHATPEEAYWSALDAVAASRRSHTTNPAGADEAQKRV